MRSDILSVQQLVQNNDNIIDVCRVLQASDFHTEDVFKSTAIHRMIHATLSFLAVFNLFIQL